MKKALLLIMGLFLASCSRPDKFASYIMSVSEKGYGVMVTKITQHNTPEVPVNMVADSFYANPAIPRSYSYTSLRKSKQIPQSELPNYLTFEYQYIQLPDCKHIREEKMVKLIFLTDYPPIKKGDIREVTQEKADYYLKRTNGIATLASLGNKEITKEATLKQYEEELKVAKSYYVKFTCKTRIPIDSLKFTKTIDLRPYKESKEIKRFRKRNKSAGGSYYGTSITYQFYDNGEIKLDLENYTTNPWK